MKKISILLIVALLLVTITGSAFAANNYQVQTGDNLYTIGQKMGIHHRYIMAANNLGSALIHPGQVLDIPTKAGIYHRVQQGENLYRIARKYQLSVLTLIEENKLDDDLIFPGQRLLIPKNQDEPAKQALSGTVSALVNSDDIELLARLIHAEARGEDYTGQLAVGAVILNRLGSDKFPNTIKDVVFQRTKGGYQFTPVADGSINLPPSAISLKAAKEAMLGKDPTGGALFFYNPDTSTDPWIKTLPVRKVIGNHVFAK